MITRKRLPNILNCVCVVFLSLSSWAVNAAPILKFEGEGNIRTAPSTGTADGSANDFVVESNGNVGISILAPYVTPPAGHLASIYFGDSSGTNDGRIVYSLVSDAMDFFTSDLSRLKISSAGLDIPNNAGSASAPAFIFQGDTNTGFYHPTGDTLAFATNSVERLRIDSAGKVGIGTTAPDGPLHVHTASAGTITASTSADELTLENNGPVGLSLLTSSLTYASNGNL